MIADSGVEQQNFRQLAELSPVATVFIDSERKLVWGNKVWQEYTGGHCEGGLLATFAIHPDDQGAVDRVFAAVYENPRRISKEFRYQRHDGQYRAFQLLGMPCLEDEKVSGLVCTLTDITDQQMVEEQMLALNDSLEDMVAERTQDLQQANDELRATQSQMLHHEKMATVGQLAAGVAHEINNPMGFINSNLNSLKKYLERLDRYISYLTQKMEPLIGEESSAELKAERKKQKIDYLLEDSTDLIDESLEGADRVQAIVRNLKSFSRVDQAEEQQADINECLDTTIAIAWNELKYKVSLEKDYAELPPLLCHPQQLNQVFMNLLVNAAQAIEEKGVVGVKTWSDTSSIHIEISDNGCGIAAGNLPRIFEPFFTTKEVGKGTGLGMSISYDIVRAHEGDIRVSSILGQGTTFHVELPFTGEQTDG